MAGLRVALAGEADVPVIARSPAARRDNLPAATTRFLGREPQLAELAELLSRARLVTLVGPGGIGKTRLAVEASRARLEGQPHRDARDGVWLVELAGVADASLVAQSIAAVLDVREVPGRPLLDTLSEHFAARAPLILLDNCEHLVDGAASVVDRLLRDCPQVRVLATSREPLAIDGEHLVRVPPLPVPDADASPEHLEQAAAVQLFCDRATHHQSDLRLDGDELRAVALICARLDGIPLAIELAAARLRSMTLGDLVARLDDRFGLLRAAHRGTPPRQRTLRTLIDWSWNLLTPAEQLSLARLSVCPDGFDLDAARAIGGLAHDAPAALDVLGALVDKSLIQLDIKTGRYRMLETIRRYAAEQLTNADHAVARAAHLAHRDHYLALVETLAPRILHTDAEPAVARLNAEHDNIRSVLRWCTDDVESIDDGLRLAYLLRMFWLRHGYASEGAQWLAALVELGRGTTLLRARAMCAAGHLDALAPPFTRAEAWLREALAIARERADAALAADALDGLGWITGRDRPDDAVVLYESAVEAADRAGDDELAIRTRGNLATLLIRLGHYESGRTVLDAAATMLRATGDERRIAALLTTLAMTDIGVGDLAAAGAHLDEGIAVARRLGDEHQLGYLFENAGVVALLEGDVARAHAHLRESLVAADRSDDTRLVGYALLCLAVAASRGGDDARAATLHGAADKTLADLGETIDAVEAQLRDADVAALRARIGDPAYARAASLGAALPLDEAIDRALDR
jgi:non-specific serine/threonine protein kinase